MKVYYRYIYTLITIAQSFSFLCFFGPSGVETGPCTSEIGLFRGMNEKLLMFYRVGWRMCFILFWGNLVLFTFWFVWAGALGFKLAVSSCAYKLRCTWFTMGLEGRFFDTEKNLVLSITSLELLRSSCDLFMLILILLTLLRCWCSDWLVDDWYVVMEHFPPTN